MHALKIKIAFLLPFLELNEKNTRENFIDANDHIKNRTVKLRVIVRERKIAGIVKGLLIWSFVDFECKIE